MLGNWGTSPGLNMLCVHLNRVIKRDDLNMIYIIGPGHGGPSMVAGTAYLEGTYSEIYPDISQDAEGLQRCPRVEQSCRGRGSRPSEKSLYVACSGGFDSVAKTWFTSG